MNIEQEKDREKEKVVDLEREIKLKENFFFLWKNMKIFIVAAVRK